MTKKSDYVELAERVLEAMATRESSYVRDNADDDESYATFGPMGHYELGYYDAAASAARNDAEATLIHMLMVSCWNDVHDWAQETLTKTQ